MRLGKSTAIHRKSGDMGHPPGLRIGPDRQGLPPGQGSGKSRGSRKTRPVLRDFGWKVSLPPADNPP
jgi:hypothetical protein